MPNNGLLAFTESVKQRFEEARSILSFGEYLNAFRQSSTQFSRNSTQYLYDAILYFGQTPQETPTGTEQRFHIFDQAADPLLEQKYLPKNSWVAGQEQAQQALFRKIENFVRLGRNNRLLLLHGPNGSGKSSLLRCLIDGAERYSHTAEGRLYRFNWIFPSERKVKGKGIGFAQTDDPLELPSYAHLETEQIDARLSSPMKDHPLLLLPQTERLQFLETLKDEERLPRDTQLPEYLKEGDLSPRNREIFDVLLAHYAGDITEVLRHVQIERYYLSQRYQRSISTIEPQMHVDAKVQQLTADRSLAALPKVLSTLNLYEPIGAIVDANRGILEYSDLLKRPLEAFKYLLSTCETGRVSLDSVMLYLDIVMLGTANEQNLDRFKEISEFTSFKSRIELIRVPYLLRYDVEKSIYDEHLKESNLPKYIGPHFTELAALWAVMTRLRRPNPERLPEEIRELVGPLTPLEKAKLYNNSEVPKRYNTDQAKILRKHIKDLIEETRNDTHYEGRIGASPREIKTLLLSAAQNERYPSATPLALFEEMEELIQDRSVYQFLQLETQNGYYDPKKFIEDLRELHLEIIDNEFRRASSLVQPNQFQRQFDRYIEHIKAYLRKEKILNPNTRKPEEADERLMQEVEAQIMSSEEQAEQFRNAIISKVAATSLENPGQKVDIHRLFQAYIDTLEYNFFTNNQKKLKRLAQHMLILIVDKKHNLSDNDKKDAEATLNALRNRFQYSDHCIKEIASLLIRKRYNAIEA